jgi:acyl-CoA synthetase (NDP forming)
MSGGDENAMTSHTLSEFDSKAMLARYDVPFAREEQVHDASAAVQAAEAIGFPVVLKLCGDAIAHKTERNLVRLALADASAVKAAAVELLAMARPEDGEISLLVAEMLHGRRELIVGLVRDAQFGPCVLLGLGGILAEVQVDVAFAAAPISRAEAREMIHGLAASKLLCEPFRGEPAVDEEALIDLLLSMSRAALENPDLVSVDLNPVILVGERPVAVDALVERDDAGAQDAPTPERPQRSEAEILARFRPLFHPRGIAVAGVSSHPGKFGFATLHNLRRFGYAGKIFPIKPDAAETLGQPTHSSVDEIPQGAADLVFVCTPNKVNIDLLRACAKKGIRAAFVTSAGYGESGEKGAAMQRELVDTANELGILMVGPNGQGVISTPESMCAQIVAPYPPAGRIAVASQSGNLVSSFLNYACAAGDVGEARNEAGDEERPRVGVSKAVSLGNSAQTTLFDMLEYFAVDPDTDVVVSYLEGIADGRHFQQAARNLTRRKPLVLLKGGVAEGGKRAAASHTGALASDDNIFDGICRQLGVLRATTVEEAFEWAATLATQPLPKGRRTVIFSTVGGWGVLAADACSVAGLDLIELPAEIIAAIDEMVPARWSRGNPIDLAGGEGRDTIPEVLELICAHPDVDAVIHLGIGIQAAQARVLETGPFHPDYGLDRIASFHKRQDRRYAAAGREASERHGVPLLAATELAFTHPDNEGPLGVREEGRLCYPSAHRAVRALRALVDYAEFRKRQP